MTSIDDIKIAVAVELLESKSLVKELEDRFVTNKRLKYVIKPSLICQQEVVATVVPGSPLRNIFFEVGEDIYREVVKHRRIDIHFKDLLEYKQLLEL